MIKINSYFKLILIGVLLFIPFLGSIHLFDWDEANFAELAREMILSKNYLQPQINYLPFYEKPPLFIWFQVLSMKLFGINEFSARFPNAILGIIVMISLFLIGKKEKDERFGMLWVMTYIGSLLPFMYFRTGLIDPWFNYFMFISLYFYYISVKESNYKNIIISALSLGLAVQTKGPVALIIVFGTLGIVWILSKFKFFLGWGRSILWVILTLFFSSFWFIYETYTHGTTYIYEFFIYQIRLFTTEDALHGGAFYYHFVVLLFGCFPASIFLFNRSIYKENWNEHWFKIMTVCGVLVLILFSIVQTKIIHYSSMAYFPISYIAAKTLASSEFKLKKWQKNLLIVFALLLLLVLIIIPVLGVHLGVILPYIKDKQAQSQLLIPVTWTHSESIYALIFTLIFIVLYFKINRKENFFFLLTPLFIVYFMVFYSPRIERYVQGHLIDFYKSKKGENVDIVPLYIKSYACFYYANKQPFENNVTRTHNYYLNENINRDAYFILRNKDAHNIDTSILTYIKQSKQLHGYTMYIRKVKPTP